MRKQHCQRGFSLLELVMVVAILGIIASIMIPSMLDSIHRAKQKRTMADLGLVGAAWMSWLTDQVGAASAGATKTYDLTNFVEISYPQIYAYLHPTSTFFYLQEIPQLDAWGSEMRYLRNSNLRSDKVMVICAAARGDNWDTCVEGATELPVGPFTHTDFDKDIIWADGGFIRWPQGK